MPVEKRCQNLLAGSVAEHSELAVTPLPQPHESLKKNWQ
jgi:hypothetical protein